MGLQSQTRLSNFHIHTHTHTRTQSCHPQTGNLSVLKERKTWFESFKLGVCASFLRDAMWADQQISEIGEKVQKTDPRTDTGI